MAAPSKKPSSKGAPPKPSETAVVGNATSKPEAGQGVPCNFRVPSEFKKRFKVFCSTHDESMVEVFMTAVNEYMERKGG